MNSNLSDIELMVLKHMATGAENGSIGAALFRSEDTIKTHVRKILSKLGVRTRTGAVAKYLITLADELDKRWVTEHLDSRSRPSRGKRARAA